jgi:hypothetical protein
MKKLLAMTALSAALFFGQTAAAEEKAAEEVNRPVWKWSSFLMKAAP